MQSDTEKPTFPNDAFISYSRQDKEFAARLEKALEDYKPPRDLSVAQRNPIVFRDEADFTGVEYHASLAKHLRSSRKLIVICSPHARKSEYVNDEIRHFAEARGADNIVSILLSGIPNNEAKPGQEGEMAFPEAMCQVMEMPLAANYLGFDPRKEKVNKGIFYGSWYTILANLYDISRSEIEQRDKKRQARARHITIGLVSGVILILLALLVYALISRQEAIRQRDLAEREKTVALDAFAQLTYMVPQALAKFPGTEQIREDVVRDSVTNLRKLFDLNSSSPDVRRELATNYRLWGAILHEQKKFRGAYDTFKTSAGFYDLIIQKEPMNAMWHRDLSVSHYNAGLMLENLGDPSGALKEYEESVKAAQRAAELDQQWAGLFQDAKARVQSLRAASEQSR
jgi:tetratricopeptide (TPR) repeat protein